MDVFADMARYLFAREFLLDRGYRICLDGLTSLSLPFIERQKLGFDLIKLHWTPQLRQQIEGTDGDKLRDAIAAANPRRIILMRCESDDRSEEHTSELQSLMRHSYAVFCLKNKKQI